MKTRALITCIALAWLALLTLNSQSSTCFAQGTAFTYQGRLNNNGSPASGTYDLTFTLFTNNAGGSAVAGPVTNSAVTVTNGLFTVAIDFGGGVWNGATNWLEIAVETNGGGAFTTLSPRQRATPDPYAITAENLNGTVAGGGLSGTYGNPITLNNPTNQFAGSFAGNGGGVTNVNAVSLNGLGSGNFWQTAGNAGTTPGANFVGTTDNQPLELHVNGVRGWRLAPTTDTPNVIGGAPENFVAAGVQGATIGGGGTISTYGQSYSNSVFSFHGTIGGGLGNTILTNAQESTIAGGNQNSVQGYANDSVVGGGYLNTIQTNASDSTIAGGADNTAGGPAATVGGGVENSATSAYDIVGGGAYNQATGGSSFVGGGQQNINGGAFATIGGGGANANNGAFATIGGGSANIITIGGIAATIGGGAANTNSGNTATIGGGAANISSGTFATIGGGTENTSGGYGTVVAGGGVNHATVDYSTVVGGYGNQATGFGSFVGGGGFDGTSYLGNTASGEASTVGGGLQNLSDTNYATIGGGNANTSGGYGSVVAGGLLNQATVDYAMVGGGIGNHATGRGSFVGGGGFDGSAYAGNTAGGPAATIGGGMGNLATNAYATVGGGQNNTNNGSYATIPGGYQNVARGNGSFAAGEYATANDNNSFIWGDGTRAAVSQGANTFTVLATGGAYFYTTPGGVNVAVDNSGDLDFGTTTRQMINLYSSTYGIGVQASDEYFRTAGQFYWYLNGSHNNANGNSGGGTTLMTLTASGLTVNGTFVSASDRNLKENFRPINPEQVLERVSALPISKWNYKQDAGTEHLGPMAQDFYAAFNIGPDDKHIAVIDEGGVALAAIQGLNEKMESGKQKAETQIQELKAENAELKQRLEVLEKIVHNQKTN